MTRASDLPIVDASIEVYEDLRGALEKMRVRATHLPDLLAIACIADEIGGRIKGLRVKRRKLAVVTKLALDA